MALNQLSRFMAFDFHGFFDAKTMMVKSIMPIKEYDGDKCVGTAGTKIDAVIIADKTKYPDPDPNRNNSFSSFVFKLPDVDVDTVRQQLKISDQIQLIGCSKASVYGKYRNELSLSVKLSDIKKVVKS